jgi:hypothetical protein
LAASFLTTRRIYELEFVARTISSAEGFRAPKKVFCSFQIFRPNGKAIGYMRAKPERGVFAVPFIR